MIEEESKEGSTDLFKIIAEGKREHRIEINVMEHYEKFSEQTKIVKYMLNPGIFEMLKRIAGNQS